MKPGLVELFLYAYRGIEFVTVASGLALIPFTAGPLGARNLVLKTGPKALSRRRVTSSADLYP